MFFEVTRQVNPGHVQVSPRLKEECYHFFFLTFPTCTIVTRSTIEATKDCSSKATLATSAIVPIATSAADDTRTVAKKYRGPKVNQRALFKIFNQWKSLQNQYIFVLKKIRFKECRLRRLSHRSGRMRWHEISGQGYVENTASVLKMTGETPAVRSDKWRR